jgi:hypothetical protein
MQTTQGYVLESLWNVKAFLESNADKLGDVINSGAKAELLQMIDELEAYGDELTKGTGTVKDATKIAQARRFSLINDHMTVISRIGRAKLPHTPELATLKMPHGNPSTARLIEAAYQMANSAQKNAPIFVAAGLPEDFAAQLKAAADAVIEARQQRSVSQVNRIVASKALEARLAAARKLVNVLDAMIKTAIRSDPTLLPGWKQAKRVSKISAYGPNTARPVQITSSAPAAPAPAT